MISYEFIARNQGLVYKFLLPDFCPFCQKHSAFTLLKGYVVEGEEPYLDTFKVIMRCNNSVCHEVMISVFEVDMNVSGYINFKYIVSAIKLNNLPTRIAKKVFG